MDGGDLMLTPLFVFPSSAVGSAKRLVSYLAAILSECMCANVSVLHGYSTHEETFWVHVTNVQ